MKVTIQSIADKAGVSIGTASRLLNSDVKGMRKDARERMEYVRRIAAEMGYRPNVAARGLALKRTFTIGVVVTELDNPIRSRFLELLRKLAWQHGFKIIVVGYQSANEVADCLQQIVDHGIDGLIIGTLVGPLDEKPYAAALRKLLEGKIPIATFSQLETTEIDSVSIDYMNMTETMTAHLLREHKLKRISFVGWDDDYSRYVGYQRAMQAAGLEQYIQNISCNDVTMIEGQKAIEKLLQSQAAPEACVCHNDLVAIGVINGLRQAGLSVPADVAVTGIDDIEVSHFISPQITSAGIDATEFAQNIFSLLLSRINGEYDGVPRRVEIGARFFLRESCGCKHGKSWCC